jgi:hypothetical protein
MAGNEMKRTSRFLLFWMIVLQLFACSDRATKYYPKYEDAAKDGAVKRGWIPEIVPKTAIEIHEQHDLDTNDVWIRFTFPSSRSDQLTSGLKRLSNDEVKKIRVRRPSNVEWWFEGLIQQAPANDNALNAEIYTVKCYEDRAGYLALDRTGKRVYFWCTEGKP